MARPFEGVILDTVTNDKIVFYSFDPLSMSRGAQYNDEVIRGRSEPLVFYSHTDAAIWNFAIKFIASIDERDEGDILVPTEQANFVESLCMPDYGNDPGISSYAVQPPHLARIQIRGLRSTMVDLIGTIRGFNKVLQQPYDIQTGLPQQIDVTFQLHVQKQIGQRPDGYADIRKLLRRGQTRQT